MDKNNNLGEIFFIFKKNQFCVGKFKPLDFPGKGKKQMLEVRRRAKGRPAKDKNIQNIENTQDIHKVYSTFETFQIFDVLNIDIWNFVFMSSISVRTFFMKSTKLFASLPTPVVNKSFC